jgi:RimJ/RimL family protein N-acetyltransferase
MELRTARLLLRAPVAEDLEAFLAMSADPDVMRFLTPLDRAGATKRFEAALAHMDEHGFGEWAVEVPGEAPFIGLIGLRHVTLDVPFVPAVEAAWRLARPYWRRGYAHEAASAAMADGFGRLGFDEIVAFTVPANTASQAVMRSLGMTRDPAEDFDHPRLPEGHPLRRHVLYRRRK